MPKARGQSGFTLIELLVAMSLMLIVMSAALLGLQTMQAQGKRNTDLEEAQQSARLASDTLASDLRNMSSPTPNTPASIDWAGPKNLIFQIVDKTAPPSFSTYTVNKANVMRVRYCLGTDPVTASKLAIFKQTQTWGDSTSVAVPTGDAADNATCPDNTSLGTAGHWTTSRQMADNIVNNVAVDVPFSYNSSDRTAITQVNVNLVVDINAVTKPPAALGLATGVFLRNQNRAPSAVFPVPTKTGTLKYRFNATASTDPEGNALNYYWYQGAAPTCPLPSGFADPAGTLPAGQAADIPAIRNVAVPDFTFPGAQSNTNQRMVLVVKDVGGLLACASQTISPVT